ncbi:MAG: phosphate acyltransferase PlsX [Candidatus Wallbacteria bacterium]|nr:phosphate acyltransferase PlsX [Candidatus Wallbacteria bacterium]
MKIALDVMGGDHAPQETVAGAVIAVRENPELELFLVGDEKVIREQLIGQEYPGNRVEILHCDDYFKMDDSPLLKKANSSINKGLELMRDRRAAVFVSAGNTGALMSNSLLVLGRISSIKRPAIATTIPKKDGFFILIDSGANSESKPEYLYQFALMGNILARDVYGKPEPKIAILNIGSEEKKGPRDVQELYQLLKSDKTINFTGNIEGNNLFFGDVDVVVADGFIGNILLKSLEGFGMFLLKSFEKSLGEIPGLTQEAKSLVLCGMKRKLDYSEYGGFPLLGVDGISIKAHGSSKRKAIANALKYAVIFEKSEIVNKFKEYFQNDKFTSGS